MDDLSQNNSVSPPLSQETFELALTAFDERDFSSQNSFNIPVELIPPGNFYDALNFPFTLEEPNGDISEAVSSNSLNFQPLHNLENEECQAPKTYTTHLKDFENDTGQYGFNIFIESQGKPTKSVPWTYSSKLDQLFTKVHVSCPVQFTLTSIPKVGSVIKAVMYYKKQEHVNFPVERCITHQIRDPTYEESNLYKHVLRCEEQSSIYEETAEAEPRMSVSVPYKKPTGMMKTLTYNYRFTCLNSCPGGMNRQLTMVMFTLEHEGIILGKRVLDVRICACPGRDRLHQESLKETASDDNIPNTLYPDNESSMIRDIKRVFGPMTSDSEPPKKKTKTKSDDSEVFNLQIRNRQDYELLLRLKNALELLRTMEDYRKED